MDALTQGSTGSQVPHSIDLPKGVKGLEIFLKQPQSNSSHECKIPLISSTARNIAPTHLYTTITGISSITYSDCS
jgi:hypothetical protein